MLLEIIILCLLVIIAYREWMAATERRERDQWYRERELAWSAERDVLVRNISAVSEDQRLKLFDIEIKRMSIQEKKVNTDFNRMQYILQNPNGELDAEIERQRQETLRKIQAEEEHRKNIIPGAE